MDQRGRLRGLRISEGRKIDPTTIVKHVEKFDTLMVNIVRQRKDSETPLPLFYRHFRMLLWRSG